MNTERKAYLNAIIHLNFLEDAEEIVFTDLPEGLRVDFSRKSRATGCWNTRRVEASESHNGTRWAVKAWTLVKSPCNLTNHKTKTWPRYQDAPGWAKVEIRSSYSRAPHWSIKTPPCHTEYRHILPCGRYAP